MSVHQFCKQTGRSERKVRRQLREWGMGVGHGHVYDLEPAVVTRLKAVPR